MLPRKFVNQQITPARGMVINRLVDSRSLILVEQVWQFKGLETAPIAEKIFPNTGRIRDTNWGWLEVPNLLEEKEYLILPVQSENMMEPTSIMLTAMIKKSIDDFKDLNSYLV
jgi:hypothetical protein